MSITPLVLDVYDDPDGGILKEVFPSEDVLPDIIKTASAVSDLDKHLPDEAYAVVLLDGGNKLRKYACVDPGNTAMSAIYFMERGHLLPPEAQAVVAHNIVESCHAFEITPPEPIEKIAQDLGTRYVDVTDWKPEEITPPEVVKHFALAESNKYPIDTMDQVKTAQAYFHNHIREFDPRDRREFAINVSNRAKELAMSIPEEMSKFAGTEVPDTVTDAIQMRKFLLGEEDDRRKLFDSLTEKVAHQSPDTVAETLRLLDEECGLDKYWDSRIPDPYSTVFVKTAEWIWQAPHGAERVTEGDLRNMALNRRSLVETNFGSDFADAFQDDPMQKFSSLSPEMKRVIARMASDMSGGKSLPA